MSRCFVVALARGIRRKYVGRMFSGLSAAGGRVRLLIDRLTSPLGGGDNAFLLVVAVLIGMVTGAAAVGFHELINFTRNQLYARGGEHFLYGNGVWLLVLIPAAGGLAVAIISRYVFRTREGHGIV